MTNKSRYIIGALLILSGCAQATGALETGIAARKQFNDTKAKITLVATCDITIGSYYRLSPSKRRAVAALCGGEPLPLKR